MSRIYFLLALTVVAVIILYFINCAAPQAVQANPRCKEWAAEVEDLENRIETEPNPEWRTRLIQRRKEVLETMKRERCTEALNADRE